MLQHTATITIDRPPDQVFGFMADLANLSRWQNGVTETKVISTDPIGVGTQFSEAVKVLGRSVEVFCEVIEYEPGRKIGFKGTSSTMQYEGRYSYEPNQNGTQLTFSGWTRLGGFLRLVEPLFGGEVKKELESEMKRIKSLVEAIP